MSWFGVGRSEEEDERKFSDKELTLKMIDYVSPYKRAIWITTILIVINTGLTLAPPYIIGRLFDMALESDLSILLLVLLVVTNLILNFLTWFLGEYLTRVITIRAITSHSVIPIDCSIYYSDTSFHFLVLGSSLSIAL